MTLCDGRRRVHHFRPTWKKRASTRFTPRRSRHVFSPRAAQLAVDAGRRSFHRLSVACAAIRGSCTSKRIGHHPISTDRHIRISRRKDLSTSAMHTPTAVVNWATKSCRTAGRSNLVQLGNRAAGRFPRRRRGRRRGKRVQPNVLTIRRYREDRPSTRAAEIAARASPGKGCRRGSTSRFDVDSLDCGFRTRHRLAPSPGRLPAAAMALQSCSGPRRPPKVICGFEVARGSSPALRPRSGHHGADSGCAFVVEALGPSLVAPTARLGSHKVADRQASHLIEALAKLEVTMHRGQ